MPVNKIQLDPTTSGALSSYLNMIEAGKVKIISSEEVKEELKTDLDETERQIARVKSLMAPPSPSSE